MNQCEYYEEFPEETVGDVPGHTRTHPAGVVCHLALNVGPWCQDGIEQCPLIAAAPDLLAACQSHGMSCGLAKDGPDLLMKASKSLAAYGSFDLAASLRIKADFERAAIAKAAPDG